MQRSGGHVDSSELERLAIRAARAAHAVQGDMHKHVVGAGRIAERAARISALGVTVHAAAPSHRRDRSHRPHPPLAATLAANISMERTHTGAVIRQGHRGLTGRNADALPRGINSGMWRHPVFGGKNNVTSIGKPYFNVGILTRKPEMEHEVEKVFGDIDDHLNRGLG